MKCEKCGNEIENLLLEMFRYDGSDDSVLHPVFECEEDAVYVDTTNNWTGYGLLEKEMLERITCPHCGRFPLKSKEIQIYDIVRVVLFKSDKAKPDSNWLEE